MSTIITKIDLGRQLTVSEITARNEYIQTQIDAQVTNGQAAAAYGTTSGIRVWNTTDAANAYIEFANTNFDPAPVSAVVQTI